MAATYIYSVILELSATKTTSIPATMGHQTHALFLNIISQVDPNLAGRLHDEPEYRPFTISSLRGRTERDKQFQIQAGHLYHLRVTLLDGGALWHVLSTCLLEAQMQNVSLGDAEFTLHRVLSTPAADPTGWAAHTDWQTLATTTARSTVTIHFASPTAFNLGDRHFALFPEPIYVWDSLMRSWNKYAPEVLRIEKTTMRDFVAQQIRIQEYRLHTETLTFPKFIQKGFVGTCTYQIRTRDSVAAQAVALAEFARYSGIGYKTTMGMGQARCDGARDVPGDG